MPNETKYSRQREAILNVLKSTKSHPTANWIYDRMKSDFPSISLGTVYRNLKMLSDNGTILKLDIGTGTEHYDGFTHSHYHFVCSECGCVSDIEMNLDFLNALAEENSDCMVDHHSLIFYGKCKTCKENGGN